MPHALCMWDNYRLLILIAFTRQQWLGERASMSRLYIRTLPGSFSLCFRKPHVQTYFKEFRKMLLTVRHIFCVDIRNNLFKHDPYTE
jgi:hypothetical protein